MKYQTILAMISGVALGAPPSSPPTYTYTPSTSALPPTYTYTPPTSTLPPTYTYTPSTASTPPTYTYTPPGASTPASKPSAVPHFTCLKAFTKCLNVEGYNGNNTGPAATDCRSKMSSCGNCASQEANCWVAVTSPKGTPTDCVQQASVCYQQTWNSGTTHGDYFDCNSAVEICTSQPFVNHAYCTRLASRCAACQKEEDKCRVAPGANQAFCSSSANGCFSNAVKGNSE